jgi:glycosyltransferase involved in cell wall biosynthesis
VTEPSCAVLIPSFNGGNHLVHALEGLAPLGLRILVVDDGSTDGSPEEARRLGVQVLSLPERGGKGRAMRRGISALARRTPPDWILFMDGDGQHLPTEVPLFIQAMDPEVDFLLGNRLHEGHKFPSHRLMTNRLGSEILRRMSGHAVPDTQCGFRALWTSLLTAMSLESEGFEIETEILLKALRMGARWRAVPVSAVYNGQGCHFVPVADTFRICMAALRYVGG